MNFDFDDFLQFTTARIYHLTKFKASETVKMAISFTPRIFKIHFHVKSKWQNYFHTVHHCIRSLFLMVAIIILTTNFLHQLFVYNFRCKPQLQRSQRPNPTLLLCKQFFRRGLLWTFASRPSFGWSYRSPGLARGSSSLSEWSSSSFGAITLLWSGIKRPKRKWEHTSACLRS